MPAPTPSIRIGICGSEESSASATRTRGIWPVGYPALSAPPAPPPSSWNGRPAGGPGPMPCATSTVSSSPAAPRGCPAPTPMKQSLSLHCRDRQIPMLAIDQGLHT